MIYVYIVIYIYISLSHDIFRFMISWTIFFACFWTVWMGYKRVDPCPGHFLGNAV